MKDILFNQAMLAKLCGVSPSVINRMVHSLDVEPLNSESHSKKFSFTDARVVTEALYASKNRPIHDKVNVFYNFKGGTGKTSLCYQVASHLSILGFNVLCLDLDPQGHLTSIMNVVEDFKHLTIYDILINGLDIADSLIHVAPGMDLMPANISMTKIEVPLAQKNKREEKLKHLLNPLKELYDFILIDTNPTISTLNLNAIFAADRINIVCETQPFSLSGLDILCKELISFCEDMNIEPNYCIVPNKYEIKTATAQEVLGALRSRYGDVVMQTIIRKSEDINIASKKKMPVSAFCKYKSTAFEDILDFVNDFVKMSQYRLPDSKIA